MFRIDMDGNEFIVGILAVIFGCRKIARPSRKHPRFSIIAGFLMVLAGLSGIAYSATASFDPNAKPEDLEDELDDEDDGETDSGAEADDGPDAPAGEGSEA